MNKVRLSESHSYALHPPYPDILEKGQLRLQGKRILICVKSLSAKMNEDAMLSAHGHLY